MIRYSSATKVNVNRAIVWIALIAIAAIMAFGCSRDSGTEPQEPKTAQQSQKIDTDQDGVNDCTDPLRSYLDAACVPVDNCGPRPNADQKNVDGDASGDVCDDDLDGDGVANCVDSGVVPCNATGGDTGRSVASTVLDNCLYVVNAKPACTTAADCVNAGGSCVSGFCSAQLDSDGDGYGNQCDGDTDGDTVLDCTVATLIWSDALCVHVDNCPTTPNTSQADTGGDGTGNACDFDLDNDGICDAGSPQVGCTGSDNCLAVANNDQKNTDGDATGDICDLDDDNDGVPDALDNCDYTQNASQVDTDGDGNGDACELDWDNDGIPNGSDNCPRTPNATQVDQDHDGVGDACEGDTDGDGVPDTQDNCPLDANNNQLDQDSDGLGNVCDPDMDGDGIANGVDNCPLIANPLQENLDGDAFGDACDTDGDGDGETVAAGDCCDLGLAGENQPGHAVCNSLTAFGINTSAPEYCNRLDDNCNDVADEVIDDDLDGWSEDGSPPEYACPPLPSPPCHSPYPTP